MQNHKQMSTQIRNPDPVDPLEAYSGLTLFPRTLASLPNAPRPSDPDDLRRVDSFLKSMPLQSPNKLLEQAKAIIDSCLGLPNSSIPSFLTSENQNETVGAKVIENPQERRPALGRKRARFSLKPNLSQPTASLEPILDMDKLKDPEEFFMAFEKHENAKRELQKQTGGVLMELNQQNPSIASRPRRPGLLGRSVKYKHHYFNEISSQGTFKENILGPVDFSVQQETRNSDTVSEQRESDDELQEIKVADSTAKAENKVNELLDELLAGNAEELDGDGAVTLLQEHLRIKPIDIEQLCLPDLQDVRRFDLKASGANLPKPRTALSDIQNVLKGISSKTPKTRRQAESSVARLASPTLPKSPLDSIMSLKKRILQSNSSSDPFSALNIDQSPARNDSSFGRIKEQTAQGNMDMELSSSPQLKSQMTEENDIVDANMSVPKVATGDFSSPNDTMDDNLSRLGSGIYVGSSGCNACVDDAAGGSCEDNRVVIKTSGSPDTVADVQTHEPSQLDDKYYDKMQMEDTLKEVEDSVQPGFNMEDSTVENLNTQSQLDQENPVVVEEDVTELPSETADTGSEEHNKKAKIATRETLNMQSKAKSPHKKRKRKVVSRRQSLADQENPAVVDEDVLDAPSKTADAGPEQHNKKAKRSTGEPLNEQSKAKSPGKKRKRKEISRRQSLAAFGTLWESGTRRSTRIRSRPLEYWRGERFLYGRINNSLATVIGIKYDSPGKENGIPGLKVKSFVSDQYKELVEQAARF